jgi:hypothetical protein
MSMITDERAGTQVVDFGTNMTTSVATDHMNALIPGGSRYTHGHFNTIEVADPATGGVRRQQVLRKTRFSVWIATRRKRMGRQFRWAAIEGRVGYYEIWLD